MIEDSRFAQVHPRWMSAEILPGLRQRHSQAVILRGPEQWKTGRFSSLLSAEPPIYLLSLPDSEEEEITVSEDMLRPPTWWLTGLSGSGKTTIARSAEQRLREMNVPCVVLDEDEMRKGLCSDLGYLAGQQIELIRRAAETAKLFASHGILPIVTGISPWSSERLFARKLLGDDFREIFVQAPFEMCVQRDPKGLYARARSGSVRDFPGWSVGYEVPEEPDLIVDTAECNVEECVERLLGLEAGLNS